jgi:hypothetical protein
MELFLNIIPFIVIFLISIQIYKQIKNKNKTEKNNSVLKPSKYKLINYLKAVFLQRGTVKFLSAIWYVPFTIAFVLMVTFIIIGIETLIFPPIPLEKMHTQEGVIESIQLRKKMDSLLILRTDDNKKLDFSIYTREEEKSVLQNKRVKLWYQRGMSSLYTVDNIIQEITINDQSIRLYQYSYEKALKNEARDLKIVVNSFYVLVFSAFMIWVQNIKEKPYHRLARMQQYKRKLKSTPQ